MRNGTSLIQRIYAALLCCLGIKEHPDGISRDNQALAPPAMPRTPRAIKWLWAAGVTGAVVAELAATTTGPGAELLRGFLQSAGAPVRERGPGGAAGVDCQCDCRGAVIGGPAVEAGPGGGPPADEGIPRPAPRP
jgi:hypothetical protein